MVPKPEKPKLRSLEEWSSHCRCREVHGIVGPVWHRGHVLCCDCARAYARQQAEAMREQAAQILETWPRDCNCGATDIGVGELHEPGCGLPNPVEVAVAIRALEVTDA